MRFVASVFVATMLASSSALAQNDISGEWANLLHEDVNHRNDAIGGGPRIGEYTGLPINEAARARADAWDASINTLPEHQTIFAPAAYWARGGGGMRISKVVNDETQQLIAYKIYRAGAGGSTTRMIWMDGRPHPPEYAAHTWEGFSTGHWEGNTLVVETTHLKAGWIRRNGLALSDRATMTERFIRHGNYITHVYEIQDPVYLTEPLIKTNGFQLTPNPVMQPYPCYPTVEVPREKGDVPHYLIGANPFTGDYAKKYKLPPLDVRGGADTALPESVKAGFTPKSGSAPSPPNPATTPDNEVHSLFVQGNVWMLVGGGVNAAVQIGDEGVLVVDTMTAALGDKLLAEIRKLAGDKPIRWIINTHVHPDHTGGNQKISEAGRSIIAGNFAGQASPGAANRASIIAHENVDAKMQQAQPPLPFSAMPTETFFTNEFEIFFNGEAVQMLHVPNAHTDGDVMVFFRKSDVLVAGDIYRTTTFPVLDASGGLNAIIGGLNQIIDITIPKDKQEGGTYVIPGHGRLTDEADVVEYRDMMTIIRDRIDDAIHKGMTLEQVKAARLVRDYEGRYGAAQGPWTTDQFIEAAYKSLKQTSTTSRREQ